MAADSSNKALIHEAYLRLIAQQLLDWESRAPFFGVAPQLMRQILVDHTRKIKSRKPEAAPWQSRSTMQSRAHAETAN